MYKLVDEKILIYEYNEKLDKYEYIKTERNKAIDYVKVLEAKNPKKTYTDVKSMFDSFFNTTGTIVLDLEKHNEKEEKEEAKKETSNTDYKKAIKFIEVEDCKIAYYYSGSKLHFPNDKCVILEKYKTEEQMRPIIDKFYDKLREIEEAERKAKQEAEQKAKEEEKKKTALKGADLLDWINKAEEEIANKKALENNDLNYSSDNDFF